MSDLNAEKLKIGANLRYEELVELIYTLDEKFSEMKINDSFFDVSEMKLILDALAKIGHSISSNVSKEDMKLNSELFSNREKHISTYGPLLIKATKKNNVSYGMEILDNFIKLNNAYKADIRTFKENLEINLLKNINQHTDIVCDNCGSTDFGEINGIATCKNCRTKYPNIPLEKVGIKEELKEKEIRRKEDEIDGLLNPQLPPREGYVYSGITANGNEFWEQVPFWRGNAEIIIEPRPGILSDDEILKYAPKSKAAKKIRKNRE